MPLPASLVHNSMQRAADPTAPNGTRQQGVMTLIFSIRHKHTQALLKQHKLILMPQTYEQVTEARVQLYYTKSDILADLPADAPLGLTFFNIAGHTGFRGVLTEYAPNPLLDPSAAAVTPEVLADVATSVFQNLTSFGGASSFNTTRSMVDGAAAIKDLDDTLRAYFLPDDQLETRIVPQAQDLTLEFINLAAPTSAQDPVGRGQWRIIPHRNLVTLRRDAQRPFLYFYTLQFAALEEVNRPLPDTLLEEVTTPTSSLRKTIQQLSNVVRNVTGGVNTLRYTFQHMLIGQFFGPVNTLLDSAAGLADAVRGFADDAAALIHWPLYAQRTLSDALNAPQYAVETLGDAATHLADVLVESSLGLARSGLGPLTELIPGLNDVLTVRVNAEDPITLVLGAQSSGPAIAAAIEDQVRATEPQHEANLAGYRDFTATYTDDGQYVLTSGTTLSNAARVEIVTNPDTALTPGDASAALGLGTANGGTERPGTTVAVRALELLEGVAEACRTLQAFPDWFAPQLDARDAALAAAYPVGTARPVVQGDQHLEQVRLLPGDTLHALAGRVGVPWDTLALTNGLVYPYVLQEPATLLLGRFTSADRYHGTDDRLHLVANQYQGQRLDLLGGAGAGQSRYLLGNTVDTFVLDQGWQDLPNNTTDYAIRDALNPIIQTSVVTSATATSLTDTSLQLVPDSQRNRRLQIGSGPGAGQQRRIIAHDAQTYLLDQPWDSVPQPGAVYFVLTPRPRQTARVRLVGDLVSVPRPSALARRPQIRSRLDDVSTVTGQPRTREAQLFGRDWLLDHGELVWNPTLQDAETLVGLANMRQALTTLVNLPRGGLEYAPALGSYVHEDLGQSVTDASVRQLLVSLDRTIRQDPRVARLAGTRLVAQGGTAQLVLDVTTITGDTVDRIVVR